MLDPKLKALASKISNRSLRNKVVRLLEDPTFVVDGRKYSGPPLDVAPAGLSHHHCYAGGYVEHVASTAIVAQALCDSVEKVYGGKVDRDCVIACVLLHDIFKPATYASNRSGTYKSSALGDHLDHLSLAISELVRRDFPIKLIHAVSAHHGEYGPIRPHTIEALICHLADFADSRLNGEVLSAAAYHLRKAVGQELFSISSKEAFEIVESKVAEGEEGVAKTYEKLKHEREKHKT